MNTFAARLSVIVSSGAGSGFSPLMPGTCGTLACLILWLAVGWFAPISPAMGILVALATALLGTVAVRVATREIEDPDPQWIVIDEWAGMSIGLVGVSPTDWATISLAFIVFRVLDMWKPGPIGWAEKAPREFGVMADDVVAGICTTIAVHLSYLLW